MDDLLSEPRPVDYAHVGLILLAFAMLATDNLVHYPLALMAALGILGMLRSPRLMASDPARTLLLLFALIWVPMVIAMNDAVDPDRSGKTAIAYLHFLPAAYYLQSVCMRPAIYRLVSSGVVILVLFAGFDAFAQLIWGADLFGYPYTGEAVHGVFYPKQRLGLFLGVLAPLYVEVVRQWCRTFPALWLVLVPVVIVALTSLKRSGWIMGILGLVAYFIVGRRGRVRARGRRAWAGIAVILTVVAVTLTLNTAVRNQITVSSGLFSGDFASVDHASGYRLSLWRTGFRMLIENPLTGIGARGYRQAYVDYAPADDFWIARGTKGQTHPHFMGLEVAVETGLIGVLGLAAFYVILWRVLLRARDGPYGSVWLLCAAVAWLPLNTHMAFYGSYWSTLTWLLLGIGVAGTIAPSRAERGSVNITNDGGGAGT